MGLLGLTLAFGFSGYLLPWNQLAFFATKVGTDIMGAVPGVGDFMLRFLRGGEHITGGTLTRFFGFHVALLPAITTAALLIHLHLVQHHGMSVPPGVEGKSAAPPRMKFVPNFLLRDVVGWLAALGLLALLSALFPWELGLKADPYASAPAGIRPEWYFGWMFQTLKMLPGHVLGIEGELIGLIGIGVAAVLWTAAPFLDDPRGTGRRARVWTMVGALAIVYIVVFTLLAFVGGKA
jgi:cytochrome b6